MAGQRGERGHIPLTGDPCSARAGFSSLICPRSGIKLRMGFRKHMQRIPK